jgi:uncharacterized protein (DUF885 family)
MLMTQEFGGLLVGEIALGPQEWAAIVAVILGAFGLFIANLFQAMKARAEAQKTNAEAQEIRKHQKEVLAQFENNGGSTLKDATDRIEQNLKDVSGRLEAQLRTIRGELGFQRREILRLAEVDDQDRDLTNEAQREIKKLMSGIQEDLKRHVDDVPNVLDKTKKEILATIESEEKGQQNAVK